MAGDGLRRGSGESGEFPTDVREVVTLLGKSRGAISNAMGVSVAKGVDALSLAFTRSR